MATPTLPITTHIQGDKNHVPDHDLLATAAAQAVYNYNNGSDFSSISAVLTNFGLTLALGTLTPRGFTVTVAASNSPTTAKANADYVCTGTNDHLTLSTAIAAIAAIGGTVKLFPGNYNTNGPIICDQSNVTFEGEGIGTYIERQASGASSSAAFLIGFQPITTTVTASSTPSTIVLNGGISAFSSGGGTAYAYSTPGTTTPTTITYTGISGNSLTGCTATGSTVLTANVAVIGTATRTSVTLKDFYLDGNYANNSDSQLGVWAACTSFQAWHVTSKSHRGDGWYIQPYDNYINTNALFECLLFDCYGAANGGQQIHIGTGCLNSELIRCFGIGASSASPTTPTRGLNGIYIEGGGIKLIGCHPYYNINDGLHTTSTAASIQVIGGEYESNQSYGINVVGSARVHSVGSHFYGNTTGSFSVTNSATAFRFEDFQAYLLGSTTGKNIFISGCANAKFTIRGNMNCSGASAIVRCVSIESSTSNGVVDVNFSSLPSQTGNIYDVGISNSSAIIVRGILENGVIESSSADKNLIDVLCDQVGTTFQIVVIGAHTQVRNNPTYITTSAGEATITSGTNSSLAVTHGLNGANGGIPSQIFLTPHGGLQGATDYNWSLITTTTEASSQVLPLTTITASGSITGFPTTGVIAMTNSSSVIQYVTYTGISGSTFTGCTGGTGTINSGATITSASQFNINVHGTSTSNVLIDYQAHLYTV